MVYENAPVFDVPKYNVKSEANKPRGRFPTMQPKKAEQEPGKGIFHPAGMHSHRGFELRFIVERQLWKTQPNEKGHIPPELDGEWSDQFAWSKAVDSYLAKKEKKGG